jgi:hypothetical protein
MQAQTRSLARPGSLRDSTPASEEGHPMTDKTTGPGEPAPGPRQARPGSGLAPKSATVADSAKNPLRDNDLHASNQADAQELPSCTREASNRPAARGDRPRLCAPVQADRPPTGIAPPGVVDATLGTAPRSPAPSKSDESPPPELHLRTSAGTGSTRPWAAAMNRMRCRPHSGDSTLSAPHPLRHCSSAISGIAAGRNRRGSICPSTSGHQDTGVSVRR